MKKTVAIIIFLIFIHYFAFSQAEKYSYYEFSKKTSMFIENDSTSGKNEKGEYPKRILRIKVEADSEESGSKAKKFSFKLTDKYSPGSYTFGEFHKEESKNFILIKGEYCFYIYNLISQKLSEVQKPLFWELEKQEGNGIIEELKISADEQYIYGKLKNGGTVLYDICSLDKPVEILSLNPPFFGTDRFFEVKECNKETYSGIIVSYSSENGIEISEVFSSLKLEPQTDFSKNNYSEEQIEEIIMTSSMYDSKFAITKKINADGTKSFVVINIFGKNILEIPSQYQESKEKIMEYVKDNF